MLILGTKRMRSVSLLVNLMSLISGIILPLAVTAAFLTQIKQKTVFGFMRPMCIFSQNMTLVLLSSRQEKFKFRNDSK